LTPASIARARRRWLAYFVFAALLAACATVPSSTTIVKSPNDPRAYRSVILPNGLTVLLVSDPKTDKAAAALTVFRGSYDDPKDRGGLAHFLEHMLFLGTAKYPEVEGYQSYITTHGGSYNAYTSSDHTNYFFDVRPDYLEGALDRFAQFFISPTFDAAYVEREKNAVNSEYQLYLKDDTWRSNAVNKQIFNPAHPGAGFNVGSLDTLKGDVRTDLVTFYQTHYSADQMALVVLGNQSLDELNAWVTTMFAAIPNRPISKPAPIGPLYAPGVLPRVVTYQTIKDTRQLNYNFPVPELDSHYRDKPGEYISNLLGHEGPGSLDAELKARGWIESLAATASRFDAENGLITVSIDLTPEGQTHIDEITRALFRYIALIRADGVARWRYQEQAEVSDLAFRFQEQASALGFVYRTAPNLRLYPVNEVLEAPYLMERYDETLIKRYLAALTPDNLLLEVSAQNVAADQIEPFFQVPYKDQKFDIDLAPKPGDDFQLALPAVNEFLPKNLALQKQTDASPRHLDDGKGLSLWWASDASFGAPRANTYVQLNVAGGFPSPADAAYADLYARLVLDALNTFAYPAQLAGLGYDIEAQSSGFLVTLTGYDDKQPLLLDHILDVFAHVDPAPDKVANNRDELRRAWLNFAAERPFEQGMASLSHVMINGSWPPAALANAIESATPASLAAWRKAHLSSFSALVLLHGNIDEGQAQTVAHIIKTHVNLSAFPTNNDIVARLPADDFTYELKIDNDDASMTLYVQGANESYRERALFGLTGQILRTPYFNDLRTQQQLGYAVFVTPSVLRRTPGLAFVVQSPVAGAEALVRATETFLSSYRPVLANMPEPEFNEYKQGLIGRLLESDKNLNDRSLRYWSDLDVGFTKFDSRIQIAAAIQTIDHATLLAFYDRLLGLEARQRLIIYNAGRFGEDPAGRAIDNVGAFRAAAGSFGATSNGGGQAAEGR
jgi:secreted Zn-dependent insulinase-like peptidase